MIYLKWHSTVSKGSLTANTLCRSPDVGFYVNQASIWALANLPWHHWLNQFECISGRMPSASLSTAASFIVCFCKQIQESDALAVTCGQVLCSSVWTVCSFPHNLSFIHSWQLPQLPLHCLPACVCLGSCVIEKQRQCERETEWLNSKQLSKASITMSSVSRHVNTETHTSAGAGMHWSLQAGCVKSINSSASSLMLFLNKESWLTQPRAKLRSRRTYRHTQYKTVRDFSPDARLLAQSWITWHLSKHTSFPLPAGVCLELFPLSFSL